MYIFLFSHAISQKLFVVMPKKGIINIRTSVWVNYINWYVKYYVFYVV